MKRRSMLLSSVSFLLSAGCTTSGDEGQRSEERLEAKGGIAIIIDGSPVDLSANRFQAEHADNSSIAFHLHESDDNWYMEGDERVTFAEAIDLLPYFAYARDNGNHIVTVDGTDYDEREPGTEILFFVNGDEIDPTVYKLQDRDDLRVEVTTDEGRAQTEINGRYGLFACTT